MRSVCHERADLTCVWKFVGEELCQDAIDHLHKVVRGTFLGLHQGIVACLHHTCALTQPNRVIGVGNGTKLLQAERHTQKTSIRYLPPRGARIPASTSCRIAQPRPAAGRQAVSSKTSRLQGDARADQVCPRSSSSRSVLVPAQEERHQWGHT